MIDKEIINIVDKDVDNVLDTLNDMYSSDKMDFDAYNMIHNEVCKIYTDFMEYINNKN